MSSANISCIPSSIAKLIKYSSTQLRFCRGVEDQNSISEMTTLILTSLMFYTGQFEEGVTGKCYWPCTRESVNVQSARLSNGGASRKNNVTNLEVSPTKGSFKYYVKS